MGLSSARLPSHRWLQRRGSNAAQLQPIILLLSLPRQQFEDRRVDLGRWPLLPSTTKPFVKQPYEGSPKRGPAARSTMRRGGE